MLKHFAYLVILIIGFGCKNEMPKEYTINDKFLVPEGIDYSVDYDAFYLSSIAQSKIIKIDRGTGKQEDFIKSNAYGYMPGVGVLINDKENVLYALGGYYMFKDSLSSLFAFDLKSKKLLKKYIAHHEGEHFLNDLIMDKEGNLFLTDSKGASIYTLKKGGNSLELFYKSKEIEYPNGIAISDDNTKLYIATYFNGIRVLDIENKTILNKRDTLGYSQRIDGLEFYKGNLFAVQKGNEKIANNFKKLILNNDQTEILGQEIIDSTNPYLRKPLTFCIVQNKAVVIANSNLQFLDQTEFTFKKKDSIQKTKLLVYDIE